MYHVRHQPWTRSLAAPMLSGECDCLQGRSVAGSRRVQPITCVRNGRGGPAYGGIIKDADARWLMSGAGALCGSGGASWEVSWNSEVHSVSWPMCLTCATDPQAACPRSEF